MQRQLSQDCADPGWRGWAPKIVHAPTDLGAPGSHGLLWAAAALTAVNSVQAATSTQEAGLAPAASYRELLHPVPNAVALLKADNAEQTGAPASGETRLAYHYPPSSPSPMVASPAPPSSPPPPLMIDFGARF